RRLLATFAVDGPQDTNPLPFAFSLSVPDGILPPALWNRRVVASATYTLASGGQVTTPFSAPVLRGTRPAPVAVDAIARTDDGIRIDWSGGFAPYAVQEADSPAGPWSLNRISLDPAATLPLAPGRKFFRIADNAPLPAAP